MDGLTYELRNEMTIPILNESISLIGYFPESNLLIGSMFNILLLSTIPLKSSFYQIAHEDNWSDDKFRNWNQVPERWIKIPEDVKGITLSVVSSPTFRHKRYVRKTNWRYKLKKRKINEITYG